MNQKNLIIIGSIIIILIALIFYIIGYSLGKNSTNSEIAYYKKIIDSYAMIPEEIFSISGEITEIQNNVLSLETIIQDPYKSPEDWKKAIIKINTNNETQIMKFDPDTTEPVKLELSGLKTGNQINAAAEENIRNKTEFTAIYIEIQNIGAEIPKIEEIPPVE